MCVISYNPNFIIVYGSRGGIDKLGSIADMNFCFRELVGPTQPEWGHVLSATSQSIVSFVWPCVYALFLMVKYELKYDSQCFS